jgi:hypothetical protein
MHGGGAAARSVSTTSRAGRCRSRLSSAPYASRRRQGCRRGRHRGTDRPPGKRVGSGRVQPLHPRHVVLVPLHERHRTADRSVIPGETVVSRVRSRPPARPSRTASRTHTPRARACGACAAASPAADRVAARRSHGSSGPTPGHAHLNCLGRYAIASRPRTRACGRSERRRCPRMRLRRSWTRTASEAPQLRISPGDRCRSHAAASSMPRATARSRRHSSKTGSRSV